MLTSLVWTGVMDCECCDSVGSIPGLACLWISVSHFPHWQPLMQKLVGADVPECSWEMSWDGFETV